MPRIFRPTLISWYHLRKCLAGKCHFWKSSNHGCVHSSGWLTSVCTCQSFTASTKVLDLHTELSKRGFLGGEGGARVHYIHLSLVVHSCTRLRNLKLTPYWPKMLQMHFQSIFRTFSRVVNENVKWFCAFFKNYYSQEINNFLLFLYIFLIFSNFFFLWII